MVEIIILIIVSIIIIMQLLLLIVVLRKNSYKEILKEFKNTNNLLNEIEEQNKSVFAGTRTILNKLDQLDNSRKLDAIHKRLDKIEKKEQRKDNKKT